MLTRYFGLLFVGMTAAAHASGENGDRISVQDAGQTTSRPVDVCIDFLSADDPKNNGVAHSRSSVVAAGDAAHGSPERNRVSGSLTTFQESNDSAHTTGLRWNKNSDGYRLLRMARHKRIELNSAQYKVTLQHESALIEAGSIKVGLGSGSTSVTWSRAL